MKKTLYVLACALCTLLVLPAAAQVPSYVPTDGLVGWWPFNGNANDESGNGNNGVVNGATLTEDRFGNAGKAYGFDGVSNSINVSDDVTLDLTSFTVSAWVYLPQYNPLADEIITKGSDLNENYEILIYGGQNDPGNVETAIRWTNGSRSGINSGWGNTQVQPTVWTHIVSQYDLTLGILKMIINGDEIAQVEINLTPASNDSNLSFGFDPAVGRYHLGKIDDIAIYNRALTEQEIQNLYTGTTPPPCVSLPSNLQQGLVGYWPFCGNANDESGNGNDGVVNGATLTEDRFGNANAAYGFDGVDDFISINDTSSLHPESFTISAWVNGSNYDGFRQILSKNFGSSNNESINLVVNDNPIWNVTAQVGGSGYYGTLVQSPTMIDVNQWYAISYVYRGLNQLQSLYINGEEASSSIAANSPEYDDKPLLLGAQLEFSQLQYFFAGTLDDIGIWNRALTPEEVQELYSLDACTFTVYDTVTVYETVYDTVYTYETIYDTVTTYVTVTDTLLIDITFVGFEGQPSWLNTVTVFPNPASDHITIDYGNFSLMAGYNTIITNAAGAAVYSSAVNSQQVEIDINAWGATGVYYMSVYDASGELVAVRHIVLE